MRFSILLSFLAIGLLALSSCQKENIDKTDIKEDDNTPDSVAVNCADLSIFFDFNPINNTLTAEAEYGTPPYSYEWSTGETTETILITQGETYTVTVTDSEGCVVQATYTFDPNDPCTELDVNMEFNPVNNVLIASTNDGTPPYTYLWSTGVSTGSININASGTYSVTITDLEGCEGTAEYTYNFDPCASFVSIGFAYSPNINELTASPFGGTAPFEYQWSTGETGPTIIVNLGDTYSVTITDSNGCALEDEYVANSGPCMDAEIQYNPANASLTAIAMGTPPYTYSWSTGQNTQSIFPVNPGDEYWVIISDADGCVVNVLFEW